MKKTLLVLGAAVLLFSACKKDDDNGGNNGGTSAGATALTSGRWLITSSMATIQFPSPAGTQMQDVLAALPACQRDNLYMFNADHTATADEGSLKCNSTDPQQKSAGNWTLSNNDAQLTLSDATTTITANVVSLTNTTLKLQYETNYGGVPANTTTIYTKQ